MWIDEHKAVLFLAAPKVDTVSSTSSPQTATTPSGERMDPSSLTTTGADASVPTGSTTRSSPVCTKHEADGIVVLGPGEAKWEFVGRMAVKKLKGHVAHVGTVEALAEFEIVALVREALDNCWRPDTQAPAPNTRDPAAHSPQTTHRKS